MTVSGLQIESEDKELIKRIQTGYRVSDFAYVTLDLLGLERYSGNDIRVRKVIALRKFCAGLASLIQVLK